MSSSNCLGLRFLVALAFATMIAGCGGGGGGGEPTPETINRAPSATVMQPDRTPIDLNVQSDQYVDLTVRADDADGDRLHCVWTWDAGSVAPYEADVQAGGQTTGRFTPPAYDGTCNVTVTISDGEASTEARFTIQVTGNNILPTGELRITGFSVTPQPVAPSQPAVIHATVENPENKTLTYKWSTRYGSVSGSGSSATWTAPKQPGIFGVYLTVSDGTKSVVSGRAITVSGPEGGLLGQYYKTIREKNVVSMDTLILTRVDPTVDFHWGTLSPEPEKLSGDGWGARWTGFVKCEESGTYVFRAFADDGARMRIQNDSGEWIGAIPNDSTNWIDHSEGAWLPAETVPVQLQGGKWYPVEVEYFEGGGNAFITLYWSLNGGLETTIDQDHLKPPS